MPNAPRSAPALRPLFSHRHYVELAAIIGSLPAPLADEVANHFARALAQTQPNFKSDRFLRACVSITLACVLMLAALVDARSALAAHAPRYGHIYAHGASAKHPNVFKSGR
jgi:hypothetical protein